MKRILFLVNHDVVIYNFRKELVESLIARGDEVFISSPYGPKIELLKEMGAIYIETEIDRHGTNPIKDYSLLSFYKSILKDVKPDVVLAYTIKPVVYGGMACAKTKVEFIANITGLGTSIENGGVIGRITRQMYKMGLRKAKCVFFQNTKNLEFFMDNRLIKTKYRLLPGSGVNLNQYTLEKYLETSESTDFLFVARIMKDKGVEEYLYAAEKLHDEYGKKIQCHIVGFIDGDYEDILKDAQEKGFIKYYGQQSDVRTFYKEASCVVLPSYHEGMANVLLEAAAMGRPIIASDIAGCRETFDDGVSGIACKAKDAESLLAAMEKFMKMSISEREAMGQAGRKKVENEFDRQIVVDSYLEEIDNGYSRAGKE